MKKDLEMVKNITVEIPEGPDLREINTHVMVDGKLLPVMALQIHMSAEGHGKLVLDIDLHRVTLKTVQSA